MNTNRKRTASLLAVAAGALAMGGVYATSLTVTGQDVGAGTDSITSCNAGAITVTSGTKYDATSGKYVLDNPVVGNITKACLVATTKIRVTAFSGTANGSLAEWVITPGANESAATSVTGTGGALATDTPQPVDEGSQTTYSVTLQEHATTTIDANSIAGWAVSLVDA